MLHMLLPRSAPVGDVYKTISVTAKYISVKISVKIHFQDQPWLQIQLETTENFWMLNKMQLKKNAIHEMNWNIFPANK